MANRARSARISDSAHLPAELCRALPNSTAFGFRLCNRGLAAKFGMRYEGVKVRDLIGGSLGFRRPGYALSVEPGAQYEHGKTTWSLNIPVAVQRNRKRSVPDLMQGKAGDAAFADYLILLGYSRSF